MAAKNAVAEVFDNQDGTSGARSGLRLPWGAKADAVSGAEGEDSDITLTASKARTLVRVSRALVEVCIDFDRQTGVKQPLGLLNAGATGTATIESGQAARRSRPGP